MVRGLSRATLGRVRPARDSSCLLARNFSKCPVELRVFAPVASVGVSYQDEFVRQSQVSPFRGLCPGALSFTNRHALEATGIMAGESLESSSLRGINVEADDASSDSDVELDSKQLKHSVAASNPPTSCYERSHDGVWSKGGQTPLELRIVSTPMTRKRYEAAIQKFFLLCWQRGHHFHTDADIDRELLERAVRGQCSTRRPTGFRQDCLAENSTQSQSAEGVRTPNTRSESQAAPVRCVRGSCQLAAKGQLLMSLYVLLALSTSLRPSFFFFWQSEDQISCLPHHVCWITGPLLSWFED